MRCRSFGFQRACVLPQEICVPNVHNLTQAYMPACLCSAIGSFKCLRIYAAAQEVLCTVSIVDRIRLCVLFQQIVCSIMAVLSTESEFVCCLTSQQRICTDNFTFCHTEIEVADQTVFLTQSQYPDTGPTSPSADPLTPGAWQGSLWSANF